MKGIKTMTTHPYDFQQPGTVVQASTANTTTPPANPTEPITPPAHTLAPQIIGNPTSTQKAPAYEELLLNDTKKFVETVRNEAASAVWERDRQKENRKTFFEEFFAENSDLKDYNAEVESILDRRLSDWGNLSVPDAKKKLATEMRGFIDRVRQKNGTKTEEVMANRATALPSSGEQVKNVSQPASTKTTNLVEEWTAYKNRNRQKG